MSEETHVETSIAPPTTAERARARAAELRRQAEELKRQAEAQIGALLTAAAELEAIAAEE